MGIARSSVGGRAEETLRWKSPRPGTGIPVSLGIAPSKTLAKIANHFAKKHAGYKGVCLIDTEEKRLRALELTPITEVWGIDRKHSRRLEQYGIPTALDFVKLPQLWVRKRMTVVGERMWRELQGESCLELETIPADKKSISISRSFPDMVTSLTEITEAVSTFAATCARKLREQRSLATSLMVYIYTNRHREDLPQYSPHKVLTLSVPTASSLEIVQYAGEALRSIFRPGYHYKKAGVVITGLIPDRGVQTDMFDSVDRARHQRLMQTLDHLNERYGRHKITLAPDTRAGTCARKSSPVPILQSGKRFWKYKTTTLPANQKLTCKKS